MQVDKTALRVRGRIDPLDGLRALDGGSPAFTLHNTFTRWPSGVRSEMINSVLSRFPHVASNTLSAQDPEPGAGFLRGEFKCQA